MVWTGSAIGHTYTMAISDGKAKVWCTPRYDWCALVIYKSVSRLSYGFRTLMDAQHWCINQIEELLPRCEDTE